VATWAVRISALAVLLASVHTAPVRAQTSPGTESVELVSGCTNVSLTWPAGTPVGVVAAAIVPSGSLMGIWKLDAQSQVFKAYAPAAPQASDLMTVNPLDAVYVCMTAAGTLARPLLGVGGIAAVPVSPSIPLPFVATLQVISITDPVGRGTSAAVTVQTTPYELCDIQYNAPTGSPPTTNGLTAHPADASGRVSWIWTIPAYSARGTATVMITCGGQSLTRTMNVL
jgi:hypothetical protein